MPARSRQPTAASSQPTETASTSSLPPPASRLISPRQVDARLRHIGEVGLEIEEIEIAFARAEAELKTEFEGRLAPLRKRRDELVANLEAACRAARDALFTEGIQSLKLAFGKVSFRTNPDRLGFKDGLGEEDVLKRLPPALRAYIRTREFLDKAGLKAAAGQGKVSTQDLGRAGLEIVKGEEAWTVKPDQDAVRAAVGKV